MKKISQTTNTMNACDLDDASLAMIAGGAKRANANVRLGRAIGRTLKAPGRAARFVGKKVAGGVRDIGKGVRQG